MSEQVQTTVAVMSDLVVLNPETGAPVTTSLKIAEKFEKNHFDVLKAIKCLEIPEVFHNSNFAFMENPVKIGKGNIRKDPMYEITRDGFTLLAMGFTGKKAMEWKLKYIEAFNKMENHLRTIAQKTSLPIDEMWKLMRAVVRSENESQESRIAAMLGFATEALNKKFLGIQDKLDLMIQFGIGEDSEIEAQDIERMFSEQIARQTDKIVTLLTFQNATKSGVKKHKTQTKRDVPATKSESVMNMLNGNQDVVRFMDDFISKNDTPVLIHCAVLYQQFLMFSGQSSSDKFSTSANWFGRMVRAYCQGKGITVTAKSVNLTIRVPDTENPDKVQSKYMTVKAYLFQKTELSENDKIMRESGVSQSGTFNKHCGLQPTETQGNQKPLLN